MLRLRKKSFAPSLLTGLFSGPEQVRWPRDCGVRRVWMTWMLLLLDSTNIDVEWSRKWQLKLPIRKMLKSVVIFVAFAFCVLLTRLVDFFTVKRKRLGKVQWRLIDKLTTLLTKQEKVCHPFMSETLEDIHPCCT